VYFIARVLFKRIGLSRSEREINEGNESQRLAMSRTFEGCNQDLLYEHPLSQSYEYKLKTWNQEKNERERELKRAIEGIRNLRAKNLPEDLLKLNNRLKEGSSPNHEIFSTLRKLEKAYETAGMSFLKSAYENLIGEKGNIGAEKDLRKLEDYITSNKDPVSEYGIKNHINSISDWLSLCGKALSVKEKNEMLERMKEKYILEAKTVSIADASREYAVKVVHGIPFYKPRGQYRQFLNNAHWNTMIREGKNPHALELEDFIRNSLEIKPDVSASFIRPNSKSREFYSPIGIILKEGKIYDADIKDITSIGDENPELIRMRLHGGGGDISERVMEAATIEPDIYNEAIIGDNNEIGGIYFVERHYKWASDKYEEGGGLYYPEIIERLARIANNKGLPLYIFRQGEGFIEQNPSDYLISEKNVKEKKARKPRRKKAGMAVA